MNFKVKVSSKNQITIPVALLKDLGIDLENKNQYLLISKNFEGRYEIVDALKELEAVGSSFRSKVKHKPLNDEELELEIAKAKHKHFKNKYSK